MRKMLSAALPMCIVVLLVLLTPVACTKPTDIEATGVATYGEMPEPDIIADGNLFYRHFEGVEVFTGNFEGTAEEVGTIVVRLDKETFLPRLISFKLLATFTGTVDGKSGTMVMRVAGAGEVDWSATPPLIPYTGRWVILSGSGGLANIHGQGSFVAESVVGSGVIFGDYSGQIHFEPD